MKLSTSSSSPPTADPSPPASLDLTPSGGSPLSKLFSMCRTTRGNDTNDDDDDDDDDSYDTSPIFCGGSGSVRKVLFPSSPSHRDDGDGIATVTSSTTSTHGVVSKLSRSFGIGVDDIPSSIQSSTSTPPPSPSRMNNEDGDGDDESSSGGCTTQQQPTCETTEFDKSGLIVPITAFIVVVVALQYQHIVEFIGQQYHE